jgi:hypothetical protein
MDDDPENFHLGDGELARVEREFPVAFLVWNS